VWHFHHLIESDVELLFSSAQSSAQRSLTDTEHKLDATETLSSELHTLAGDIEEKKARLEKIKNDFQASKYESKLAEKATKARNFEDRRDELNAELRGLTLQMDSRSKLDLKSTELKTKTADVKNTCVFFLFSR
jgi:DNA repair protein RAD50